MPPRKAKASTKGRKPKAKPAKRTRPRPARRSY